MAIYRQKRDKCFTVISNDIVQGSDLTFRARGLLEYMLSLPDDWKFYKSDLVKRSPKEGPDAIETALKELEAAGYLRRIQKREKTGRFGGQDWIVSDTPTISPQEDLPVTVKPEPEEPVPVNPSLQRTNNNKELNKQNTNPSSNLHNNRNTRRKNITSEKEKKENKNNNDLSTLKKIISNYAFNVGRELTSDEINRIINLMRTMPLDVVRHTVNNATVRAKGDTVGYLIRCLLNAKEETLNDQNRSSN